MKRSCTPERALCHDERMKLWLTDDADANAVLSKDPLALLLGMLLDQHGA